MGFWAGLPYVEPELPTRRKTFLDIEVLGGVSVGGDIISANWNGAKPANLATRDTTATAGFYLDSSVGASQWMGDIFVGGTITATDGTESVVIDPTSYGSGNAEVDFNVGANTEPKLHANNAGPSMSLNSGANTGKTTAAVIVSSTSTDGRSSVSINFMATSATFNQLGFDMGGSSLPIGFAFGSAAAPGLIISGDPTTGFYRFAASKIGVATGGAVRGHWSSTGLDVVGALSGLPWQAWTPTLTNITKGNGTIVARYVRIGDLVVAQFQFTLGSTSAMGTDGEVSAPITMVATLDNTPIGNCTMQDATGSTYLGTVVEVGGKFRPAAHVASATHVTATGTSSTVPMTWTTSDVLAFTVTYEAA